MSEEVNKSTTDNSSKSNYDLLLEEFEQYKINAEDNRQDWVKRYALLQEKYDKLKSKDLTKEEVVEETVQENQDAEAKKEAEEEKNEKSTEDLLQEERDKFLRLFAEFENYKKRTSKERIDLFKTASSELMSALLPVQDDFQRALEQLKLSADQEILQGVELIHNKFKEVLKAKGLVHIEVSAGDDFNADIHEAITQIPAPSPELAGKIVDVVEQGYKLGERILRHPKVVVGKS